MYNTTSSFDANLARDPTNMVETEKQDGTSFEVKLALSHLN